MSEHEEQALVIQWAKMMEQFCPELELLYATPLGGYRPKKTAVYMMAEGAKGGVPDLCLPVARQGYHGFYIEMKFKNNKPTERQRYWMSALSEQGYRVDLCYSADTAIDALCDYLNLRRRFF